jgi:hypothetical protein
LKNLAGSANIQIDNGTNTLIIKYNGTSGSGFTNITPVSTTTNATLIVSNSSNIAIFKNLAAASGIQIDNGTNTLIIDNTQLINPVSTSANATLIVSNSSNIAIFKNLSGINGTSIDNGTNTVIIKQTYINSLSANVTTSLGGTDYAQIFRIPLTANSGNALSGVLVMTMASAGVAPQLTANVTNTNTSGQCAFSTPATVSTSVLAYFSMNSSNPTTDTATTTPYPLSLGNGTIATWQCSIVTGATPGDFRLLFQSETAGTAVNVKAGSYYIKTP